MTRMDRRALFTSGAAAALLAATGVSAEPKRGGRLRVALSCSDLLTNVAETCLSEGLTEIAADGTLRGEIATKWQSDQSGRIWEFQLRETVFHDGAQLTEADLIASLGHLGRLTFRDTKLAFELYEPNPNLPLKLAQTEHLIRPGDTARRALSVRSGLYRMRVQEAGRHLIAERVQRHWKENEAGWFDEIELVKFSDAAVRMQALREGIVDLADVTTLDVDADPREFTLLPDARHPTQIVSKSIALPTRIGTSLPFDNLRMAERWWIA